MVDIYQPELRVEQGEDGLFVVHAVTPTPNTCHSAREPRPDESDDEIGIPESQSFVLPIERMDGLCGEAITPVRHQFTVLPQPGKQVVTVTTTLDGREVGHGSITLPAPGDPQEDLDGDVPRRRSDASPLLETGEWHAFVDLQPGGDPLFYVEGIVTLGHPGYEVSLTAPPDNCEDGEVLLELTVEKRDGVWIQIPVRRSVRYEQSNPPNPIDTVVIQHPETDQTVTIDVQTVH